MSGGSVMVFPLRKMNILRDEGRGPPFISVTHIVYLLVRCDQMRQQQGTGTQSD
jgi:hypothetical protein